MHVSALRRPTSSLTFLYAVIKCFTTVFYGTQSASLRSRLDQRLYPAARVYTHVSPCY